MSKVAVVTGANKGIGYAIVRGLCKRFNGIVYLTSRDQQRGEEAVASLEKEGLHPRYAQLDITDKVSVEAFRKLIKERHGGIDVLVNNAAIAFKSKAPETPAQQAKETVFVNYFSLLSTCEILFPIVRNGGRVVNVSSAVGHLSMIPSQSLRDKLEASTLTVAELSELMNKYVEEACLGTHATEWGNSAYGVSKVGVSALTRVQQRLVQDRDIKVNSVHPGYVDTDMSSHCGHLSIDEGALAPLFLALDAPDSLRGAFVWQDKRVFDWAGEEEGKYIKKWMASL